MAGCCFMPVQEIAWKILLAAAEFSREKILINNLTNDHMLVLQRSENSSAGEPIVIYTINRADGRVLTYRMEQSTNELTRGTFVKVSVQKQLAGARQVSN